MPACNLQPWAAPPPPPGGKKKGGHSRFDLKAMCAKSSATRPYFVDMKPGGSTMWRRPVMKGGCALFVMKGNCPQGWSLLHADCLNSFSGAVYRRRAWTCRTRSRRQSHHANFETLDQQNRGVVGLKATWPRRGDRENRGHVPKRTSCYRSGLIS